MAWQNDMPYNIAICNTFPEISCMHVFFPMGNLAILVVQKIPFAKKNVIPCSHYVTPRGGIVAMDGQAGVEGEDT